MGRRGERAARRAEEAEPVRAREDLEMRWRERLTEEPRLATMVTSAGAAREPFHRWMHYRQGFSPGLVRLFLNETGILHDRARPHAVRAVLDPFSGAGTTVVECARLGVRAAGVEALESVVFLSASRWIRTLPPLPRVALDDDWVVAAEAMNHPAHRAALMLAVGRQCTTDGRRNRGAKPLAELLPQVVAMMTEDLVQPLVTEGVMLQGDARRLSMIADESVTGILTSPPYLSRHDYREAANPLEQVYRHWVRRDPRSGPRAEQLQASPPTVSRKAPSNPLSLPASVTGVVEEVCGWLIRAGFAAQAAMIRAYAADMSSVLGECFRVLAPQGRCWLVIGGARIKDVYFPSDLMVAELAEEAGFEVEALRVARDLVRPKRKFGRIGHVAPRETLLVMAKR